MLEVPGFKVGKLEVPGLNEGGRIYGLLVVVGKLVEVGIFGGITILGFGNPTGSVYDAVSGETTEIVAF